MVHTAVEVPSQTVRAMTPGKHDQSAADPMEVQQALLRFADQFLMRMVLGVDQLRRGTNVLDPAELLRLKLAFGTQTCTIASGPNAVANLLDLTILVSVSRRTLEEHWQPQVFGESARPMLESCRQAETEIWLLAARVLKPEQQAELRQAIEVWLQQNPTPDSVMPTRSLDLAIPVAAVSKSRADKPDSVFSLLRVDPLAGMDPAVHEIAQTRMFAERAVFVFQRMPLLLRWQAELLTVDVVGVPAMQQLVVNSAQLTSAVERFAAIAEKLPGQVSTERAEILQALEAQEEQVASLLSSGTRMSDSLNTTITNFDRLMKRFGVGETKEGSSPRTNAEPFRIQDYGQTAVQFEAMARQLTELLDRFDQALGPTNLAQLSTQVGPVVQQAQAHGKALVDYAFWRGLFLVVSVLVAALVYRFLTAKMAATSSKSSIQ